MFLLVFAKYGRGSVNLGEVWKTFQTEPEILTCPKSENSHSVPRVRMQKRNFTNIVRLYQYYNNRGSYISIS